MFAGGFPLAVPYGESVPRDILLAATTPEGVYCTDIEGIRDAT